VTLSNRALISGCAAHITGITSRSTVDLTRLVITLDLYWYMQIFYFRLLIEVKERVDFERYGGVKMFGIRTYCRRFFAKAKYVFSADKLNRRVVIRYNRSPTYGAQLADKYHTDKGTNSSTDIKFPWPCHTYTDIYDLLFFSQRLAINRVFECGIGSTNSSISCSMSDSGRPGASLRMWREYFPNAYIYGADIDESILFQDDRITTAWVDQLEPNSIKRMYADFGYEKFDLMIDDGLHTFEGGRTLYENSIDYLSENGIYIVEDVGPHDLVRWVTYFNNVETVNVRFVSLLESGLDRYNNNIIIITPVDNTWC
jgi:hypothetical protein